MPTTDRQTRFFCALRQPSSPSHVKVTETTGNERKVRHVTCFVSVFGIHVLLSTIHLLCDGLGRFHCHCAHVASTTNKASRANKEPLLHVIGDHTSPLTNHPTLQLSSSLHFPCSRLLGTNMPYPPLPNKPTVIHDQFPPTVPSHSSLLYPVYEYYRFAINVLFVALAPLIGPGRVSCAAHLPSMSPMAVPLPSSRRTPPPTPLIMKHQAVPDLSLVNAFAGLQTPACVGVGCMRRRRRIGRVRYSEVQQGCKSGTRPVPGERLAGDGW